MTTLTSNQVLAATGYQGDELLTNLVSGYTQSSEEWAAESLSWDGWDEATNAHGESFNSQLDYIIDQFKTGLVAATEMTNFYF